ncbi:hypothetical protein H0X06_03385 [Candidatus Dependentiae bacterium]|nr:hypothetical protein [Candidatus Dependentiae bacterium]
MKKIFLATLMLASISVLTMHTPIVAMETGPKTKVINATDKTIEVTYSRAQDTKEITEKVGASEPFVIEQSSGNPVQQMFIRFIGAPQNESIEIDPIEILSLTESAGEINVMAAPEKGTYALTYNIEMAKQNPGSLGKSKITSIPSKDTSSKEIQLSQSMISSDSKKDVKPSAEKKERRDIQMSTISEPKKGSIEVIMPTGPVEQSINKNLISITRIRSTLKNGSITIVPSIDPFFSGGIEGAGIMFDENARTFLPYRNWPTVYDISTSPIELLKNTKVGTAFILVGDKMYRFTHEDLSNLIRDLGRKVILIVDQEGNITLKSDQ